MYRTSAHTPGELESISLAKQYAALSAAVKIRIEEERKSAKSSPAIVKQAKKLYPKILEIISIKSKKGKTSFWWANRRWFGVWTIPLVLAEQICLLLKEDGFICNPQGPCNGDNYYISISWG